MTVVAREAPDRFRVQFEELAREVVRGHRRGDPVQVDPYLIARGIAAVMRACKFRSAAGHPLLWNEYRMILARADFELVRALEGPLERDLGAALAAEPVVRESERVGDLRISVVLDEGDELRAGEGMVRVSFVPSDKMLAPRAGELTVRFDAVKLTGLLQAVSPTETVIVADTDSGGATYLMRWAGGEARLAFGAAVMLGRPHAQAPERFVALTGASPRINKQHLWVAAGPDGVRIGRLPDANPVHVNGAPLAAGAECTARLPVEISLSRGELVVTIT